MITVELNSTRIFLSFRATLGLSIFLSILLKQSLVCPLCLYGDNDPSNDIPEQVKHSIPETVKEVSC